MTVAGDGAWAGARTGKALATWRAARMEEESMVLFFGGAGLSNVDVRRRIIVVQVLQIRQRRKSDSGGLPRSRSLGLGPRILARLALKNLLGWHRDGQTRFSNPIKQYHRYSLVGQQLCNGGGLRQTKRP